MARLPNSIASICLYHHLPYIRRCQRSYLMLKVVLTALEKDPHKRFASVQAFAAALEQASQGGLSARAVLPPELTRQSQPLVQPHLVTGTSPCCHYNQPIGLLHQANRYHQQRRSLLLLKCHLSQRESLYSLVNPNCPNVALHDVQWC